MLEGTPVGWAQSRTVSTPSRSRYATVNGIRFPTASTACGGDDFSQHGLVMACVNACEIGSWTTAAVVARTQLRAYADLVTTRRCAGGCDVSRRSTGVEAFGGLASAKACKPVIERRVLRYMNLGAKAPAAEGLEIVVRKVERRLAYFGIEVS